MVQARDGIDLDQGKKWSNSGFTLKVEQTEFADRLVAGGGWGSGRMRRSQSFSLE